MLTQRRLQNANEKHKRSQYINKYDVFQNGNNQYCKNVILPKLFCKVNEITNKIPLGCFNSEKHREYKNCLVSGLQIFFYRHYSIIKFKQIQKI